MLPRMACMHIQVILDFHFCIWTSLVQEKTRQMLTILQIALNLNKRTEMA